VSSTAKRRAVFCDRDGVLIEAIIRNNKPYAATHPEEVRIIDGVRQACAKLKSRGFLLLLVTNQPDVARGKITRAFVDEVNASLVVQLGLDGARVCDHDNVHNCACRKPKPGLMTNAAEEFNIDLPSSIVVGDRWRDIEAGRRAGCRTVFIDYGYDEPLPSPPDHRAASLADAVAWICSAP
jgi:D-glycero-D-manno-heptose 1,7-bisphosphate phosphatase